MRYSGKVATVEMAINLDAPTLGTFKREIGQGFTEGLVMGWLAYLNNILNLKKPMTDDQIELCAITITQEFYMLKISDITLLFKRIISGAYGDFYESLGVQKVLTYFREYTKERLDIAEQMSISSHKDFASDETFNYSDNMKRIIKTGAKKSK